MTKPKALLIVSLFISLTAFKSDNLPPLFGHLLERAQLVFIPPADMVEVPIVKNSQMNYEYALKFADKNFEVRYSVRPLDSMLITYKAWEKNKKDGEMRLNPNNFYSPAFMATMMNISAGHTQKPGEFPAGAVKNEFNADWGAVSPCELAGDFGKGYKFGLGMAIHKADAGDAYIFFLTDDKSYFQTLLPMVMHSLKFK